MNIREPILPRGWYPHDAAEIKTFLKDFDNIKSAQISPAVIAPHAGWYFCGETAAISFSALDKNAETIVIIGGHLPPGHPVLFAEEDGVRTPLGIMEIDKELLRCLREKTVMSTDRYRDNTVEVLLPMAKFFFPDSKLLLLRFPAEMDSFNSGKILSQRAENLGRKIAVLASTDLTHYGRNYNFSPAGSGLKALEWVRETNDAGFIRAVLEGNPSMVLERAEKDFSSCSAGAVLGLLGFSQEMKLQSLSAKLLDYRTSADAEPAAERVSASDGIPDSFVGYASISF